MLYNRGGGLQVDPLVVPDSLFFYYLQISNGTSNGQPSCFATNISYNLRGCGRINPLGVHRRAGKDPAFIIDETKKSPQIYLDESGDYDSRDRNCPVYALGLVLVAPEVDVSKTSKSAI